MPAVASKKLFQPAQLGVAAVTYYTVGANIRTTIDKLTFSNNTAIARLVTVYLVPSGGTASDTNTIRKTKTVPPNDTWECYEAEGHVLEAGDFIQALCDLASAVSIMGSGREMAT